ncbi:MULTISPECIES: hypothetical protein [Pseudomonas]|uniref:hypothetical protein n=1 Tax=Pseudomonas TaxID=286 RepID=UPI001AE836E5|nr:MULTISPECIES: hypothetical protein [unclassified Pseudomonas]MBP1125626.1 hypothetical protein [Pseudomonas sp. PvP025]MDQ0399486.1 hypothetical protein [Pseudomonas sp. PvP006]
MDLYGAGDYLSRAKKILSGSESHSIKYACLELRFCLEIIAYRQLEQYGEEIPGSVVREWKPDRIIKLLASFSPGSDQDSELSIGLTNAPDEIPEEWAPGGNAKAIPWGVFRKHYNKLGSYLHAPKKIKDLEKVIDKEKLNNIISDIERVLSATIVLAFKSTINAECDCGKTIFIGQSEFEDDELVRCGNRGCGLLWKKVTLDDGVQVLQPARRLIYKCTCGSFMHVSIEKVWDRFKCEGCGNTYRLNLGYSQVTIV